MFHQLLIHNTPNSIFPKDPLLNDDWSELLQLRKGQYGFLDIQLQRNCSLLDGNHLVIFQSPSGSTHVTQLYWRRFCLAESTQPLLKTLSPGLWWFNLSSSIVNLIDFFVSFSSLSLSVVRWVHPPAGQRADSCWLIHNYIAQLLWYSPDCTSIKTN